MKTKVKLKFKQGIKPKPLIPIPDEDDEEEESIIRIIPTQIMVGDIMVSSKTGLPNCKKTIKNLLKDKTIKNYLEFYKNKKYLGSGLDYIG